MVVHGYRVDVRKPGTTAWNSLSQVEGQIRLGRIQRSCMRASTVSGWRRWSFTV